ncbi:MAG: D-alanine--D-alanine ligase [Gammaproteobacteria bacterium]
MNGRKITNAEDFGRVAVLMGGSAAERAVSLNSGTAVLSALRRRGVNAVGIDVQDDVLRHLQADRYDRVFNVIHGRGGEDGVLQGVLETLHLPYTGSGVLASALSMDKLRTKWCWRGQGLPTPAWMPLHGIEDIDRCIETVGFPMIVKPALEGSSIGMSKAENRDELSAAWQLAAGYCCDVYAETWIDGKEYTVAILDNRALPAIRLETPRVFYDYEAKYCADTTQYHCPCGLEAERETQLQHLALAACAAVGVRGWARVDVFIDRHGASQLIEVNTVPGMTDHSLVPMAAKAAGMDFDELVWRILETSMD